jgi:hypothetical protein
MPKSDDKYARGVGAMKAMVLVLAAALLTACASQNEAEEQSTQDMTQAVRDYIEVRGLQETDKISTSSRDRWTALEDRFLLYEGRRETHLVEFNRRCWELDDSTRIVADVRRDAHSIRARFDTIRGCRIHRIFALRDDEVAELESIGEAVGSRN